mmetsp:Transcript_135806/g.434476  ORF Transcript_135806/g.434476 Transcript_135806/m.434476 type:complete len:88 (-) Transcript_135806:73-336(-)
MGLQFGRVVVEDVDAEAKKLGTRREAGRCYASWHASSPSAGKCVTAQAEGACVGEEVCEDIVGRCVKTSSGTSACAEDVDNINSFLS